MFSQLTLGASLYVGDMLFYAICFLVLMALIAKFAWNPVNAMLKERADRIANDMDSAENARKDAQELAAQRKQELDNSQAEATNIISNAKDSGNKQRGQIISDAQKDAQLLKENAQRDIDQQRDDALKSAKDDVASLSIEIASKLMKKELNSESQKGLIDSYIEGLGKSNESR
ncbi:F0F1 ATP synthase subunit B [Pediococcus claussenii]|uniref:ATP synthase subunit b n=1 Tax=Pediococcus claussenii (strain ATCC BAA-344 / DSM 14800 / JCM 18046 / KCTC 3811 / LMG 21948 / P06) TaxID=701521 RepID=G8PCH0_PEDCP|nr:F0F1 ATP synthase subunit B [Pediococcus claussenii]AEV94955.1 ATP synthase F0, B subunit [Pediococcus claussenii ATCC BAA-344]ANZ70145.1 F0F1 ATP synthase subunit B [Pediococcus claussenii]ANZ71961.1 F0F1 ATP synthase subunit B [Pediococcus claussenii]KRN19242.1 atpF protein [Pediococcus claussenii]